MLGIIFLLILTLGNALLLHANSTFANAHDFAIFQLTQRRQTHYEWDAFLVREIIAVIVTAVLFGGIATLVSKRRLRREVVRPPFSDQIANRR